VEGAAQTDAPARGAEDGGCSEDVMAEFILILTLVTLTSSGDGIANSIESIPGFKSQEECQRAGVAWLAEVRKLSRTAESSFSCVRQLKK
jgi:hypothetical protein